MEECYSIPVDEDIVAHGASIHVAKKSNLILFADDTNIFVADHNLNNLICNINYELQLISEWFQVNKLSRK